MNTLRNAVVSYSVKSTPLCCRMCIKYLHLYVHIIVLQLWNNPKCIARVHTAEVIILQTLVSAASSFRTCVDRIDPRCMAVSVCSKLQRSPTLTVLAHVVVHISSTTTDPDTDQLSPEHSLVIHMIVYKTHARGKLYEGCLKTNWFH